MNYKKAKTSDLRAKARTLRKEVREGFSQLAVMSEVDKAKYVVLLDEIAAIDIELESRFKTKRPKKPITGNAEMKIGDF